MKRLVAYFSASKTTEKVANMIAEEGGYDICEITPKEAYSQISKMKIYPEEFEKTPKKSIKRYLYQIGVFLSVSFLVAKGILCL